MDNDGTRMQHPLWHFSQSPSPQDRSQMLSSMSERYLL